MIIELIVLTWFKHCLCVCACACVCVYSFVSSPLWSKYGVLTAQHLYL